MQLMTTATRFWIVVGGFAMVLSIGCEPPPRPGFAEISANAQRDSALDELAPTVEPPAKTDEISLAALQLPWESWHSYFMGGAKVGYIHVQSAAEQVGDVTNVRTIILDQLTLRRGTSEFVQSLRQNCLETQSGNLVSFESDLRVGPARTRFEGRTEGEDLIIERVRGLTRQTDTIAWSPRYHGFAGIQQTLLAKPMKLNESRRIPMLMPVQNRLAIVSMRGSAMASISTLDGVTHDALEVEVQLTMDNSPLMETTMWTNDMGELLKSYTPALDLVAIRTTQTEATESLVPSVDLLSATAIKVEGKLAKPSETYRAGYLITPRQTGGDSSADLTFGAFPGQSFRTLDDGSLQLLVSRDPKDAVRSGFTASSLVPEDGDKQSGPIIDSQSADVRKIAGLSTATNLKELALDLTRTVKQLIGPGDYSRGFAIASQTARDGVGDCTERSVLLAAMLRARQVPARVAAGLVYVDARDEARMAFHMWTLAWIDDHWVSLDPSSGGLAPADRITLTTSNLADGNEYEFLLPILSIFGKADIKIANAQYQLLE